MSKEWDYQTVLLLLRKGRVLLVVQGSILIIFDVYFLISTQRQRFSPIEMTNWCVVILAAFVYLAFYGSGEFNCNSVVFVVCGCLVNDGISRCHQSHTIIKYSLELRTTMTHNRIIHSYALTSECPRFVSRTKSKPCSQSTLEFLLCIRSKCE